MSTERLPKVSQKRPRDGTSRQQAHPTCFNGLAACDTRAVFRVGPMKAPPPSLQYFPPPPLLLPYHHTPPPLHLLHLSHFNLSHSAPPSRPTRSDVGAETHGQDDETPFFVRGGGLLKTEDCRRKSRNGHVVKDKENLIETKQNTTANVANNIVVGCARTTRSHAALRLCVLASLDTPHVPSHPMSCSLILPCYRALPCFRLPISCRVVACPLSSVCSVSCVQVDSS